MTRRFLLQLAAAAPGPTWTFLESGVKTRLRGVSAVNENVAWASGANGTILRTANAGMSWERLSIPNTQDLDFRDIDAVNERTAFILSIGPGAASRIYKIEDAGASWQLQFQNTDPKAFYDAMAFSSPEKGIAISDSVDGRFVLITTGNGGRTWHPVAAATLPPALPGEGAFAASGTNIAVKGRHIWIGTTAGRVLHSHDNGRTWAIATTALQSSPSAGIFSIAFRDQRRGIVVGGDYKREDQAIDNVALTGDGGQTWQPAKGLAGFRSVAAWLAGTNQLLAVGPTGADVSTDNGHSWRAVPGPGFHTFSAAPGARVGWAAGERGLVARLHW